MWAGGIERTRATSDEATVRGELQPMAGRTGVRNSIGEALLPVWTGISRLRACLGAHPRSQPVSGLARALPAVSDCLASRLPWPARLLSAAVDESRDGIGEPAGLHVPPERCWPEDSGSGSGNGQWTVMDSPGRWCKWTVDSSRG